MIKLAEIAEEAGFSVAVVSRALSLNPHKDTRTADSTKEHIRKVAKRMGYRPNRNAEFLKRGQNSVIGCFLPLRTDTLSAKLMKGISEEADKNNFPLAFYFDVTKNSYLEFIERSQRAKNCGIITYPYFKLDTDAEAVILEYQKNDGKIVIVEGGEQGLSYTSVSVDNYHGGKLVAEHLLKHEVKQFITRLYKNIPERISGFVDTIRKAEQTVTIYDSLDDIIEKVKSIKKYPVGMFLPCDKDAVVALCEFQRNNIAIGKDVLIIGYDDQYLSQYVRPALTTISQPFDIVGKLAVQKLIGKIYDNSSESILIKPELIIRDSA